jgi:hypothetical protein
MKHTMTLAAVALSLCLVSPGHAQVPRLMNYQGRLLDTGGVPLSTNVTIHVGIYSNANGGAAGYTENIGVVPVQNGLYAFQFGNDTPALTAALGYEAAWLELAVNGVPLAPRQMLVSVPYAMLSERVQHIDSNTVVEVGAIPEFDPVFLASPAGGITATDTATWATAAIDLDDTKIALTNVATITLLTYGWGDHATNDYLGSYTETDPVWSGVSNGLTRAMRLPLSWWMLYPERV